MHAVTSGCSTTNFAHSIFVLLYSCHRAAHRFYYRTCFDVSTFGAGPPNFGVSSLQKKGTTAAHQQQQNQSERTQTELIDGPTIAMHRNKLKMKHLPTDRQAKQRSAHTPIALVNIGA